MAVTLTLRHWVAGATFGCLALATALIPAPEDASEHPRMWMPVETARDQVGRALGRAQRAALFISRRDELLAAVRGQSRPGQDPMVLIDPRRPDARQADILRLLRTRVDSAVQVIGPLDPSVNLVVVATRDTSYSSSGGMITFRGPLQVLPEGTDGHTCLVILPGAVLSPSLLGACTFYAAFGQPGPGVLHWLQAVNYYPTDEPDWSRSHVRESFNWETALQNMSWMDVVQASSQLGLTLNGSGCAAGKRENCRGLVDGQPWMRMRQGKTGSLRAIVERGGWRGDELQGYLADLVRQMGRERFAQFWRSPLPRDSAFAAAYGMPMEEWTHRWLVEQRPNVHVGPAIRTSSVFLGLLFAGLLVAGGAYYTTRRQIA
jgi:hypothetical protein